MINIAFCMGCLWQWSCPCWIYKASSDTTVHQCRWNVKYCPYKWLSFPPSRVLQIIDSICRSKYVPGLGSFQTLLSTASKCRLLEAARGLPLGSVFIRWAKPAILACRSAVLIPEARVHQIHL